MRACNSSRGFSLIEVMVASAILACAVLSVAQLVAAATSATAGARGVSEATLLAWQKLDELRSLTLAFDDTGGPVTDASLSPSPDGALSRDTAGYVDYVDALGEPLADEDTKGARYRRRWAVSVSGGDPGAVTLRVRVFEGARDQELASAATIRVRRRP
jgi:prepilin-type N-terminal cleavage/methylation domain-containing protein